jgi:NADP-dependent 3-hydroxy acid dehydrogenase YdfG
MVDVADDTSVAAAAHQAPDVSTLVNNAGISLATPILDAPLAAIRSELDSCSGSSVSRERSLRSSPTTAAAL